MTYRVRDLRITANRYFLVSLECDVVQKIHPSILPFPLRRQKQKHF